METPIDSLSRLEHTIASRRGADPDSSYVAQLFARGLPVMARKFGEESVEAVVAALAENNDDLVGEAADVIFHLMVMLAARDIALHDIIAELDRREGVSGLDEKASRSS